ncbi:MAG: hypothetical protein OEZ39_13595 [Gammaproteobacteria bacterium]|nr:hypothetical protein [Gammaproteobacteria bacterium]MDH5652884.1 hypothetical protein [Gammaproteobacteria bacterium]
MPSAALRLNEKLVLEAEVEGRLFKRSAPKQIEFWAELGKTIAQRISSHDVIALLQGIAEVKVETISAGPLDPDEVFSRIEAQRTTPHVSRGGVVYEASRTHPGMLDRIQPDGSRDTGHFHNGLFTPSK